MIIDFALNLIVTIVGVLLGAYILFFGRRELWLTLGIVGLAATANLLAVLVADVSDGRELVEIGAWGLVGVSIAVGALGIVIGRYRTNMAVNAIGFVAGASIAMWLHEIAAYLVTDMANLPSQSAIWTGWALALVGGLLGLWLVRKDRHEALILITALVGVGLVNDSLDFSNTRSITAIILLGLALSGILAQYAAYLRESSGDTSLTMPEPQASTLGYFQNLDLG